MAIHNLVFFIVVFLTVNGLDSNQGPLESQATALPPALEDHILKIFFPSLRFEPLGRR